MTIDLANKVYDVLVNLGGAGEHMRHSFVHHHTQDLPCGEWRFQGKLFFGGKFRDQTFTVDCYREDELRIEREFGRGLIPLINAELAKLKPEGLDD